jgi:DnaJ-class molecular chaperone
MADDDDDNQPEPCAWCAGLGKVGWFDVVSECPACNGTGLEDESE